MSDTKSSKQHNALSPYLVVSDLDAYLRFLSEAFDAELLRREEGSHEGGEHAECMVVDTVLMMGASPSATPTTTLLHLYVDNVEDTYQRALDAGAESLEAPTTPEYGGRRAAVKDPAGNTWFVAE
jgi:uncharacterized glyoxalase superfamily protein PhnB